MQYDDTAEGALRNLAGANERILSGRLPAWVFNSVGIWALERDRLFGRTWVFLAHESEIPSPGDYVIRPIADNSIIVARDEHGEIRAHLNMCRHRGNQLCKAAMGNASHFRCSYHGWTYKNSGELIGVPYYEEAYEKKIDRREWGLVPVHLGTYEGLIFGALDPEVPELEEYLGDFKWYLDFYLKPGPNGTEVYGPPDQWEAPTDWKICAENFAGDGYHTPVAHQFGFELGYFPSRSGSHFEGHAVHIPERGHGIGLGRTPGMPPFAAFPEEVIAGFKDCLTPEQFQIFSEVRTAVGTVFPNVSLLVQPFSRVPGEPGVRFCTLRLWHPIGPGRIRMYSWCLVPKDAPQDFKDESYRAYTLAFGQAGVFEQDDFENWTNLTAQAGGSAARELDFSYVMGLERETVDDFPGPGVVHRPYVTEANFRNMWSVWYDYLRRPRVREREEAR